MREVLSSEAATNLASLLDEVERGETVVIARDGKPIARLVPEENRRKAELARVFEDIQSFRKTMPQILLDELLSARHDGHKY